MSNIACHGITIYPSKDTGFLRERIRELSLIIALTVSWSNRLSTIISLIDIYFAQHRFDMRSPNLMRAKSHQPAGSNLWKGASNLTLS